MKRKTHILSNFIRRMERVMRGRMMRKTSQAVRDVAPTPSGGVNNAGDILTSPRSMEIDNRCNGAVEKCGVATLGFAPS
jgi:hypothetical protein